jgi:hypothetical protein
MEAEAARHLSQARSREAVRPVRMVDYKRPMVHHPCLFKTGLNLSPGFWQIPLRWVNRLVLPADPSGKCPKQQDYFSVRIENLRLLERGEDGLLDS